VLDQLTYGPLCNVLLISYLSLVVEGRSGVATRQRLRADYPTIQVIVAAFFSPWFQLLHVAQAGAHS